MQAARVFKRVSALGAAAQASVPGVYAWASPWRPSPGLAARPWSRRRRPSRLSWRSGLRSSTRRAWSGRARVVSLWGSSCRAPSPGRPRPSSAPLRIDAPRGLAGMLGWALFALASAAPALQGTRKSRPRDAGGPPGAPQGAFPGGRGLPGGRSPAGRRAPGVRLARRDAREGPPGASGGRRRRPGAARRGHRGRPRATRSPGRPLELAPPPPRAVCLRRARAPGSCGPLFVVRG